MSGRGAWGRLPFAAVLIAGLAVAAAGTSVPVKAAAAQWLLDRAWAESRERGEPVKAWPWADAAPIAVIEVPRLGVRQVVLSGGSGEAMAFGPTLMPGGAELGGRGTAVFAAHRDTHFRFLELVRQGDTIVVETVGGVRMEYWVTGGKVVRDDAFGVNPYSRESIVLSTCWPFDGQTRGPWRWVTYAERMS
ncbi:sortase domain-containing protein [Brevundimonas sp. Root1279]|uniref:sortase domain-containing protein n=1 Tax=Brevundimonas sp. Root1279 TaxID=1736443 RepID=UPI0006F66913|nr:sortase [Brevundimonas sp. Root1279]KQW78789.1 hypothetical protein ASC65_15875 [Brevundimonas sp. Root1279]